MPRRRNALGCSLISQLNLKLEPIFSLLFMQVVFLPTTFQFHCLSLRRQPPPPLLLLSSLWHSCITFVGSRVAVASLSLSLYRESALRHPPHAALFSTGFQSLQKQSYGCLTNSHNDNNIFAKPMLNLKERCSLTKFFIDVPIMFDITYQFDIEVSGY